jgi:GNAT superfamily N-acetyltransferase
VHGPPFRATMELMIDTAASFEEISRFLYRDPFANASILAAVERRRTRLRDIWTYQERDVKGVLVFSPGPAGERGVGLEAETPEGAAALLESLPAGEEFGFGLHRSWMVPIVEDLFRAERDAVMCAFRCDTMHFQPAPGGRPLTRADDRAVRRCHDEAFLVSFRDAVRGRLTGDRLRLQAFGAFDGDRLASRCLSTWGDLGIDTRVGTVWSVYTEPSCRGRGFGRAAVAAATAMILATGRTARYFSYAENEASRRLCTALGYRHDHDVHYLHGRRRRVG